MSVEPEPVEVVFRGANRMLWIVGVGFVIMVVIGVAFASRFGKDPRLVYSPLIGKAAPAVSLPYLEKDGRFSLADLEGRVVVVNFWASWCFPCRQEHDALVTTAAEYASSGVTFVGILYQDSPENGIAFLDELGRGYDSVVDADSRAAIDFGVFGVPETFFIDATGTIVGKFSGAVNRNVLTATLDSILSGEAVESGDLGPVQQGPGG